MENKGIFRVAIVVGIWLAVVGGLIVVGRWRAAAMLFLSYPTIVVLNYFRWMALQLLKAE